MTEKRALTARAALVAVLVACSPDEGREFGAFRQPIADAAVDSPAPSSDASQDASPGDGSIALDAGAPVDGGSRPDGSDAAPFDLLPPLTPNAQFSFLSDPAPQLNLVGVATFLPADLPDLSTGTPTPWIVTPSDLEFFPDGSGESLALMNTGLIAWLDRDMRVLGTFQIDCANTLVRYRENGNDYSDNAGLLGAAFDPNFEENGYLYVHVVATPTGGVDVWRMRWKPDDLDAMWEGREQVVSIPKPPIAASPIWLTAHDGGNPSFGPDGLLYIGIGDGNIGGGMSVQYNQAQDDFSYWGKILRLDPHGNTTPEIVAKGLRNPFTHTWRGSELIIGDVGSDATYSWEEINRLTVSSASQPPVNFGWPYFPGPCALTPPTWYMSVPGLDCSQFVDPVHGYTKSDVAFFNEDPEGSIPAAGAPFASAVLLGPAYGGGAYGGYLDNVVIYTDLLQNWVRGVLFDRDGRVVADRHLAHEGNWILGFAVGPDRHIYMISGFASSFTISRFELAAP